MTMTLLVLEAEPMMLLLLLQVLMPVQKLKRREWKKQVWLMMMHQQLRS